MKIYMFSKHNLSPATKILRFSVDCFFIYISNGYEKRKLEAFLNNSHPYNFKLEDRITKIFNHKSTGYIMENLNNDVILKVPGLSLSIADRSGLKFNLNNLMKDYYARQITFNKYFVSVL